MDGREGRRRSRRRRRRGIKGRRSGFEAAGDGAPGYDGGEGDECCAGEDEA